MVTKKIAAFLSSSSNGGSSSNPNLGAKSYKLTPVYISRTSPYYLVYY